MCCQWLPLGTQVKEGLVISFSLKKQLYQASRIYFQVLKVSLATESPLQKTFSQYQKCVKSYCYYYFFKYSFLLNKEIKKTAPRSKISWCCDKPERFSKEMNTLNTQSCTNCLGFAICAIKECINCIYWVTLPHVTPASAKP